MPRYKYNEQQLDALRNIPILKVLACGEFGFFDLTHTSKGVYKSPFRPETTPSFHIDERLNRWYDYGMGKGGDVIKMIQMLSGKNFNETCGWLAAFESGKVIVDAPVVDTVATHSHGKCRHEITSVTDLLDSSVIDYITKMRHIPTPLARRYCRQINYNTIFEDGHSFSNTSFGFENLHGDYTVRNMSAKSNMSRYLEMGALNISIICADGTRAHIDKLPDGQKPSAATLAPTSPNVLVFEGFIDFLSFMAWTRGVRKDDVPATADVVVLNSVANVHLAQDYLAAHTGVFTYLDNDTAGERATEEIRTHLQTKNPEALFQDVRQSYRSHNDVNEAFVAYDRKVQTERMAASGPQHRVSEHAAMSTGKGIK